MKSPLRKRIPRELKGEIGKYLVVFILMVATIGMVSGFLVADGSMIQAYDEGFEKYNIEDGNFRTGERLYRGQREAIEEEGVKIYENYYIEDSLSNGSTMRFFKNRTAFQKPVLSDMVTVMYRTALRKVEKVIFENQANAQEFKKRRILSEEKEVVLHGAGINLKEYRYRFYPNNEKIHFLYLGRIMKEKGMDELFGAIERLRKDGCEFVLDLVGFFEEEYRKKVEHLQKEGIKSRRLCNDVPVCVC